MKVGILIVVVIIISFLIIFASGIQKNKPKERDGEMNHKDLRSSILNESYRNINSIYFAGGCFWGVEGYFKKIDGVLETQTGYANGETENPTYEEVINNSGHAETVKVNYDENVVSLEELVLHFLRIVDPYSVNKQGNDIGIQYRSGI